jgi:hypothetical protein
MKHCFLARDGLPLSPCQEYETNPRPPILVCPGTVELELSPVRPAGFPLSLRIPKWLNADATISINGKPQMRPARGTFARIYRKWQRDDVVTLNLPFTFRTIPIDSRHPGLVAVMHGPVMLSAIDAPPGLAATGAALNAGKPLHFDCQTPSSRVRFKPFYQVTGELYSTYVQTLA